MQENTRDTGLIPGSERSPWGGHGNPLHYSCLENPTDRGAWWATVHRVAQSQTQLKKISMHTCTVPLWGEIRPMESESQEACEQNNALPLLLVVDHSEVWLLLAAFQTYLLLTCCVSARPVVKCGQSMTHHITLLCIFLTPLPLFPHLHPLQCAFPSKVDTG